MDLTDLDGEMNEKGNMYPAPMTRLCDPSQETTDGLKPEAF